MLNEQVRKLLVANLIIAAGGCGWGRESVEPSTIWSDATPTVTAPAAGYPSGPNAAPTHQVGYESAPTAGPPMQNAAYTQPPASGSPYTPAPYTQAPYAQTPSGQAANGQAPDADGPQGAGGLQYGPTTVQPNAPYQQQYQGGNVPPSNNSTIRPANAPLNPQAGAPGYTQPAPNAGPRNTPYSAPDRAATNSATIPATIPAIGPVINTSATATAATNAANSSQASTLEKFEPAKIVAQVGGQYILAGDVLGAVNQMLEPHKDKMTPSVLEQQKELLVQRMVKQMIDTKLLFNSFLSEVPPDRLEEALANIRKQAFSQYDEQELEKAMEKAKVNSPAELDTFLRQFGTSLYKQKQQYMELQLGRTAVRQNINANPEITHQEMLDYYHEHADEFKFEAKARWEKLTARHDKFPDRQQARYAIGVMGDQVRLGGAPLSAVAKRGSQGFDRDEGGYHDWTTKGSLKSTKLDQAIFGLPPGLLSTVIDDETGFHIVRVIERVESGRTPFVEAQVEIKQKLLTKKRQEQIQAFLKELRADADVWTVFDDKPADKPAAEQARSTTGQPRR